MRAVLKASLVAVVATLALFAACNNNQTRSGPLPTPAFVDLETPGPNNSWDTITSLTPAPGILPTRGRAVRIGVTAPIGSTFDVSVRSGTATPIKLPQSTGAATPADAGYFEILTTTASSPPLYRFHVRVPVAISDPSNYTIDIVNKSLRTDVTDSAPLSIMLMKRMVFTITVSILGSGRVQSNPAGILCGTAASGTALTACSATFAESQTVTLAPNSNGGGFKGWSGNCPAMDQVCTLTLNGTSGFGATARFGTTTPAAGGTCPTAPVVAGWRWLAIPDCATGVIDAHPGISHPALCDANGFFCCEPGPSGSDSPRCGGIGKIESAPDCRGEGIKALLRQPGGCYEVDEPF